MSGIGSLELDSNGVISCMGKSVVTGPRVISYIPAPCCTKKFLCKRNALLK